MENQPLVKQSDDSFSIFDKLDEQQIINADKAVKQKMIYQYKGKEEITYSGIKFIILSMSRSNEVVEIEETSTKLEKDVEDDETKWYWRSVVKLRNSKTNYPTTGLAECAYLDESGNYHPFARQMSHSKAERNAQRKQIPEQMIVELLKLAKKQDSVHSVDTPSDNDNGLLLCSCKSEDINPNKFITKCLNCNGAINEFMKNKFGLEVGKN
jgi:hypothetical protein